MMTSIPHSGDQCSGLCRENCGHWGCWQCGMEDSPDNRAARELIAMKPKPMSAEALGITEAVAEREKQKAIAARTQKQKSELDKLKREIDEQMAKVSGIPQVVSIPQPSPLAAMPVKGPELTTITREALAALVEKAGLEMDWNRGEPLIYERNSSGRTMKRVRLNNVPDVYSTGAMQQAAQTLAQAAASTFDKAVEDIVSKTLNEELFIPRVTAQIAEEKARAVLKAQGASDDDIAAAEELLKGAAKPAGTIQYAASDVLKAVEALKAKAVPAPYIAIVHPSDLDV